VGKFLTQTNDYFFPPAAPIIYAVFLLTLLLYLRVREEPARTVRHDLYAALDNLPHFLDHDLDARRYAELCDHLRDAREHAQDRKLSLLAGALLEAVESEYVELARRPRSRWERWVDRLRALEASRLTLPRMRYFFAAVLLAMGAGAFTELLVLLWTAILPLDLERAVYIVSGGADEPGGTRLFLLFSRFLLAGIVGMLLVLGAVLLVLGRVRAGIACGYFGLLLSLTILRLLVFYFDQFDAVSGAGIDFAVLLGLVRYRRRYALAGEPRGQVMLDGQAVPVASPSTTRSSHHEEPHRKAMIRSAFTDQNSAVPRQSGRIPPKGISRAYTRDGPAGPRWPLP
jgi:hypothetical protein